MTMRQVVTIVGLAALFAWPAGARQQSADPEGLFQAALYKEQVELKLEQAIAGYADVVARASGNRALAAKALLQMARCYERLGRPEARATYERIVRDYSASGAFADSARARLAAMVQSAAATAERLWETDGIQFVQPDAVSRDGGYMSFMDDHNDIGIRDLSSGRMRMLTTKGGVTESWGGLSVPSPDGRFVAYNWWDSDSQQWEFRIVGRDGGEPRVMRMEPAADGRIPSLWTDASPVPVAWTPDSRWVLAWRPHEGPQPAGGDLIRIPVAAGQIGLIKTFAGGGIRDIAVSPDGRFVAYSRPATSGKPEQDVFSLSIESGREVNVTAHAADDYMLGWLPNSRSGQILFASDRDGTYGIWTMGAVDGRAQGVPTIVLANAGKLRGMGFIRQGHFYLRASVGRRVVYLATLDPVTGKLTSSLDRLEGRYSGGMNGAVWSPDGDRLAYTQLMYPSSAQGPAGAPLNEDRRLAIQTVATGEVRLLPLRPGEELQSWLQDGRSLAVSHRRPGAGEELIVVDADSGARTPTAGQESASPGLVRTNYVLSPDGRRVFFVVRKAGPASQNPGRIWLRDLASGKEEPITAEIAEYFRFHPSPDGQWLSILRPRRSGDRTRISVMPSSGGDERPLSPELNDWPLTEWVWWSADSRFLFVQKSPRDKPHEIWQVPVDGGAPRYTGINSPGRFSSISTHPNGQRVAISQATNVGEVWVLKNIPVLGER